MAAMGNQINVEDLLGVWRLKTCESWAEDGSVAYFYGEKPEGMLAYHADGTMMVILMKPDRPRFVSADSRDGSLDELKAAFLGFNAYCGTFTLDPDVGTVTHRVEQSLRPSWIGTEQVRFVSLENDVLSLSTPPMFADGKEWTFYLEWTR